MPNALPLAVAVAVAGLGSNNYKITRTYGHRVRPYTGLGMDGRAGMVNRAELEAALKRPVTDQDYQEAAKWLCRYRPGMGHDG